MVKISVIIPVYKAEAFIEKCAQSFKNQSLTDYELIFVNDCSPDNSLDILKRIAANDNRIRVLNLQHNVGPMCARLQGYRIASGEYITFCDSDDVMPYNSLEILYNKAHDTKADIVAGSISFVYINQKKETVWKSNLKYGNDKISVFKALLKNEFRHNLVGKLIKRDLLLGYNYSNVKGLKYFEDFLLLYQLVDNSSKCVCIQDVVYNYIQTGGSSTMLDMGEQRIDNIVYAHKQVYDLLSKYNELRPLLISNYQLRFFGIIAQHKNARKKIMMKLKDHDLLFIMTFPSIVRYNDFRTILKIFCKIVIGII